MSRKRAPRSNRRRRRLRLRRATPPGTAPGVVRPHPESHPSSVTVMAFDAEHVLEMELSELGQLPDFLRRWPVTWINVNGLRDVSLVQEFGRMLGLHPLALEDVMNVDHRAKVEDYDEHIFLIARMVQWGTTLETEQLSVFLGRKFVLTFQERPGDCFEVVRERIRKAHGRVRVAGADYLAYALLDAVIDSYFPVADAIGDRLETLDEQLARERSVNAFRAIHELRGDLMILRRAIRPLRDALIKLLPDPGDLFSKTTQLYLRDCYDHAVQLMDLVDTYRELCADLRDFNLSLVSNRMNDVMKVLTVIATIFIPLSFIAGVYGMNFDTSSPWNMPELSWRYGYPAALLLMAGVAGGMLWYFQRRGWLGGAGEAVHTVSDERHGGAGEEERR